MPIIWSRNRTGVRITGSDRSLGTPENKHNGRSRGAKGAAQCARAGSAFCTVGEAVEWRGPRGSMDRRLFLRGPFFGRQQLANSTGLPLRV